MSSEEKSKMYRPKRSEKLMKILKKLFKRDKVRYEAILKKIDEITHCENPDYYKNLSYEMKEFKEVHIDSHFVLIFKVDEKDKIIEFCDMQHQDKIFWR